MLTVVGYSVSNRNSTSTPCAAATPSSVRLIAAPRRCSLASLKRRTVASNDAVSGMMLRLVPPLIVPTVITTGSKMSNGG